MKAFSSRIHLLLVLPMLCATANLKCIAKPGDMITHTTTNSTVVKYSVTGWQNELTSATPNLNNYYWEPMSKRITNTTRTTSKGATTAPTIVPDRSSRSVRPIHLRMPGAMRTQSVLAEAQPRTSTSVYSVAAQPVLSYSDTNIKWSSKPRTESTATAASSSQESVYGVLKTPRSLRARAQSL